jgi:hypothetical protein
MQTIVRTLGAAGLATALMLPAALPAQAQSGFSFSFGNMDQSYGGGGPTHHRDFYGDPNWQGNDGGPDWQGRQRRGGHVRNDGNVSFSINVNGSHGRAWRVHVRNCENRYQTYDRDTDMYLGRDNRDHYCRL